MRQNISKFVYWTPRILSIIFILFLMMFSLDVFDESAQDMSACNTEINNYDISCIANAAAPADHNFWDIVLKLFIHNIPALILAVILIISWRREIVGGIVFILAGFAYIIMTMINGNVPWYIVISWSLTIAGPALLIGILFILNWRKKKKQ